MLEAKERRKNKGEKKKQKNEKPMAKKGN